MKRFHSLLLCVCMTLCLLGCQAATNDNKLPEDVVRLTYQATSDDSGTCQPRYQADTPKNQDGLPVNDLYIIYGETEYFDAVSQMKIGEVPFQVKMYRENVGLPSEQVACHNLMIRITLEKCVYNYPSERQDCPPIEVVGDGGFANIEVHELTEAQP